MLVFVHQLCTLKEIHWIFNTHVYQTVILHVVQQIVHYSSQIQIIQENVGYNVNVKIHIHLKMVQNVLQNALELNLITLKKLVILIVQKLQKHILLMDHLNVLILVLQINHIQVLIKYAKQLHHQLIANTIHIMKH